MTSKVDWKIVGRTVLVFFAFTVLRPYFIRATVSAATSASTTNYQELAYQQEFDKINRTLPKMVDAGTRLDTMLYLNHKVFYRYTMINRSISEIDEPHRMQFQSYVGRHIINGACTTPGTRKILDAGIAMSYAHYSNDGALISEIEVTRKDCI